MSLPYNNGYLIFSLIETGREVSFEQTWVDGIWISYPGCLGVCSSPTRAWSYAPLQTFNPKLLAQATCLSLGQWRSLQSHSCYWTYIQMIALLPAPSGDCHIVNWHSTTLLSVDWQSGGQHTCLTLSWAAGSLLIFGCVEPPSPSMKSVLFLRLHCG